MIAVNPGMDDPMRAAVLQRLALLDQAAGHADARTLIPLARTELSRLADGWRLLLAVHQPNEDSRCRACPNGLRGRRWPCQVWRMAHRHLIGDGVAHNERTRPLRNPLRRKRGETGSDVLPELPAEQTTEIPIFRQR